MNSTKTDAIDVKTFRPDDITLGDAIYAGWRAAQLHDVPDVTPFGRDNIQAMLETPPHGWTGEYFVATVGDEVVGALLLFLPQLDNTHLAHVEGWVHVEHRRMGVGRRLYAHTLDRLRELGRTTLVVRVQDPADADPPAAGPRFADAVGMTCALTEVTRRLQPGEVDTATTDALLADCRARATDYELLQWSDGLDGATPPEHVDDLARLEVRLDTDAPTGDLNMQAREPDPESIRARCERNRLAGIRNFHTAVRHRETGRIVAWTLISSPPSDPGHCWQGITVVDPDHRGKRLGTYVKLENLPYATAMEPSLRVVETNNAGENAHMIAINEALGYRIHGRTHNYQKEV
ncbi:GNAT family N-acetyltransferase [Phytomonospora endophytica]|uniref:RimJ/RimL family protein N-acetyltransferase n=1 Tax=Phytomonospora endophytica TaxID=714109 RepID=A0A841FR68_9ACTN|nr:GNAT family N-acetyltransferase [Phytomonospora endophytica]MBB6039791.1 RimJ/RimL family protein N-acetyltransferase [Phytomonospora endophytica]GIG70355.1 GNAT family N-acetyltransferase [Phytomonospora endophytica]